MGWFRCEQLPLQHPFICRETRIVVYCRAQSPGYLCKMLVPTIRGHATLTHLHPVFWKSVPPRTWRGMSLLMRFSRNTRQVYLRNWTGPCTHSASLWGKINPADFPCSAACTQPSCYIEECMQTWSPGGARTCGGITASCGPRRWLADTLPWRLGRPRS